MVCVSMPVCFVNSGIGCGRKVTPAVVGALKDAYLWGNYISFIEGTAAKFPATAKTTAKTAEAIQRRVEPSPTIRLRMARTSGLMTSRPMAMVRSMVVVTGRRPATESMTLSSS
jgi:hypothetical protein